MAQGISNIPLGIQADLPLCDLPIMVSVYNTHVNYRILSKVGRLQNFGKGLNDYRILARVGRIQYFG